MPPQMNLNTLLTSLCVIMVAWLVRTTNNTSTDMRLMKAEMDGKMMALQATVDGASRGRWGISYQTIWVKDLQYKNPSLIIPDPRDTVRELGE